MSLLADSYANVDVLHGWSPGEDAGIARSLPYSAPGGVPVGLRPGMIMVVNSSGEFALPATPVASGIQAVYFCVQGTQTGEYDTAFTEKAVGLRGALTVKTDQFVTTSIAVGCSVTFNNAGQIIFLAAANTAPASALQRIGTVTEVTTSYIVVELAL